ncbi:hypothetical protein [Candidatus Methanoperedens nitratireducens]|uniref:Uncharacterized protein n=1 Tax=Candidatus Methanoperedens nitratireducens TaxID=1392998 RepID=A0A284VJG3_9EURY|nr:hypothetical protein [Candidatus Methanoperedens nitroreducens]SNQ59347.1 hypothetical protein MNV_1140043 [Candidatus Methanoperedens nitroreducens]
MESVYFYEEDAGKEINKILRQEFKKTPCVIKDCALFGSSNKGYFLYVRSRSEAIDRIEKRLEEFGITKIIGEEKKAVCRAIIADEIELAALGFRTMFKKGRLSENELNQKAPLPLPY